MNAINADPENGPEGKRKMQVKYKYVDPLALPPVYATVGSACFDLHSIDLATIRPGEQATIRTGLVFEVPLNHVMLLYSRSGHAAKFNIRLANCVGVIDSDYRGQICVLLHNDGFEAYTVRPQDRIAQAMILPLPEIELVRVQDVTETARGMNGFGSTG